MTRARIATIVLAGLAVALILAAWDARDLLVRMAIGGAAGACGGAALILARWRE